MLITNLAFSQTKKDATDYINYYFNGENWAEKYSGGFTFNLFNNSIQFKLESVFTDVGTSNKNCLFTLKNIKKVDFRTFSQKDGYDVTILISFNESVYCDDISKKKNEVPIVNSGNKESIAFSVKKYVTEKDLESFKNAVLFLTKN
jgi:hypothetical protein